MPPYTARVNAWNYVYRVGVSFFDAFVVQKGGV